MKTTIELALSRNGIQFTDEQTNALARYAELLKEYNEKFNLTAITTDEDIAEKHFADSLIGLRYLSGKSVLDAGSGAGFPSIPLRLFDDERKYLLLDSLNKRVGFLNTVINELKLENITARHVRLEDAAREQTLRGKFDCVIARAVAELNTLAEYALPFLKVGGILVAYKGSKAEEEITAAQNALKRIGGKVAVCDEYVLADGVKRHIVVVRKTAATSSEYPRGKNLPRKSPL